MNAVSVRTSKLQGKMARLSHTLSIFFIPSHDDIQRIGIVTGMV